MTQNSTFAIGQKVNYTNGSEAVYTGTIVKVSENSLVVIDDEAGMALWNAGVAVGSCIAPSQIVVNK